MGIIELLSSFNWSLSYEPSFQNWTVLQTGNVEYYKPTIILVKIWCNHQQIIYIRRYLLKRCGFKVEWVI